MTRRFQRVYRARKTKRVNSMVIDYSVCLNGENFESPSGKSNRNLVASTPKFSLPSPEVKNAVLLNGTAAEF